MKKTIVIALLFLFVTVGCASYQHYVKSEYSLDNEKRIVVGMTSPEVINALGAPLAIRKDGPTTDWTYNFFPDDERHEVHVYFNQGTVVSIEQYISKR